MRRTAFEQVFLPDPFRQEEGGSEAVPDSLLS